MPNSFRVPKSQWKNWSDSAQAVFNSVYTQMTEHPKLFLHPKATRPPESLWDTTAWNAAWVAADAVDGK